MVLEACLNFARFQFFKTPQFPNNKNERGKDCQKIGNRHGKIQSIKSGILREEDWNARQEVIAPRVGLRIFSPDV